MKKIIDLVLIILGGIGAIALSITAIVDHNAVDMASAIPPALLCCSMFIAGYISWRNDAKNKNE